MARRRSGKKIDFVHWTGFSDAELAMTAGTAAATLAAATHEPETILRIRGNVMAYLDGALSPGALISMTVGFILVPEGTGVTVLWSPFTDPDAPWIWVDCFHLGYEEHVIDVVDSPQISAYRSVIDNKAMRITRNEELQVVYENTTLDAAATANIAVAGRVLSGT